MVKKLRFIPLGMKAGVMKLLAATKSPEAKGGQRVFLMFRIFFFKSRIESPALQEP